MQREIRSLLDPPTLSEDAKTVTGYIPFNSLADLGEFREVIRPHAFDSSLASGRDIKALADHDSFRVLGSTKAGTLRLSADTAGLRWSADLPDRTDARDFAQSIKRGDISGCSFGFQVPDGGDTWRREGDTIIRELTQIDLYEVSPCTFPAYPASDTGMRSLEQFKAEEEKAKRMKIECEMKRLNLRQKQIEIELSL